jgi:hypothetical protein
VYDSENVQKQFSIIWKPQELELCEWLSEYLTTLYIYQWHSEGMNSQCVKNRNLVMVAVYIKVLSWHSSRDTGTTTDIFSQDSWSPFFIRVWYFAIANVSTGIVKQIQPIGIKSADFVKGGSLWLFLSVHDLRKRGTVGKLICYSGSALRVSLSAVTRCVWCGSEEEGLAGDMRSSQSCSRWCEWGKTMSLNCCHKQA